MGIELHITDSEIGLVQLLLGYDRPVNSGPVADSTADNAAIGLWVVPRFRFYAVSDSFTAYLRIRAVTYE